MHQRCGIPFLRLIKPSHLVPVNALWLADGLPDDNRSWQARYVAPIRAYGLASESATQSTSGEPWVMSRVRVLLNSPINRTRSPSPRRWLLRLLILAILRSHPPIVLSLFLHHRHGCEQLPPGSRRGRFIFYHRASSPLARLRVPPSLRLQVARNSLQSPLQRLASSSSSPLLIWASGRARCENIGSFARWLDGFFSVRFFHLFSPLREFFLAAASPLFLRRACIILHLPFPFSRSNGRYYFCSGIPSDRSFAYHRCRTTGRNLYDNGEPGCNLITIMLLGSRILGRMEWRVKTYVILLGWFRTMRSFEICIRQSDCIACV